MENFKVKKSIQNRVDEINALLPIVNDLPNLPYTYGGGTFPSYVILTDPILIKGSYVYIIYNGNIMDNYDKGMVRFNLKKKGFDESMGEDELKEELKVILKAFKKAIKEQ